MVFYTFQPGMTFAIFMDCYYKQSLRGFMKSRSVHLVLLGLFWSGILSVADAEGGFKIDIGYWRIIQADTEFTEGVTEGGAPSIPGISPSLFTTSKSVFTIDSDPSKFLIDASYRFVDSLHRLTVGLMVATNGDDSVDEISFFNQGRDLLGFIQDVNFNARDMNYYNFYSKYRLLPMSGGLPNDDAHLSRGLDLWLTWTTLEQDFVIGGRPFNIEAESLGIGVGGEQRLVNDRIAISGRMIWLPFLDLTGSGWDTEIKIAYVYNDFIEIFLGGKWINVKVDADTSIAFIGIPGFADVTTVFKRYKADLSGYVLGGSFRF